MCLQDLLQYKKLTSLNSAICFCENKTKTLEGAFLARLELDPRVEPRDSAADAPEPVSAAESAVESAAESLAFFFLTFFSPSDCK